MSVILQQQFPLGRFHATRWKQNPFEDRHGEWPPSPWRLLRALAARWIQYSRETGDEDTESRDELLRRLAAVIPEFSLPPESWRAEPAIRQYHKTGVEWTAKGKKDAAYKKSMTTLAPDHCRAIPSSECVYWLWPDLQLPSRSQSLLDQLLRRMLFFGRAESYCRISRLDQLPEGIDVNCRLSVSKTDHAPVLVPKPDEPLNLDSLLAASDDRLVKGHAIPPGAVWHYAELPKRSAIPYTSVPAPRFPATLRVIQFAVGGRVYPRVSDWVRVTERFRGSALKELARLLTGDRNAKFSQLPDELRDEFTTFSGKSALGQPLSGHCHPYFALYPDEFGQPTRLVCFRREPFRSEEVAAIMAASERPCSWRFHRNPGGGGRGDEWQLRFVPLPFDTPPPQGLLYDMPVSSVWTSATPFVIPGGRRRFRKHGRLRPGETADKLLVKLLISAGYVAPALRQLSDEKEVEWGTIHETNEQRKQRREERSRAVLPGYRFRLEFPSPVSGPICVGHSCHFGLGLFVPDR